MYDLKELRKTASLACIEAFERRGDFGSDPVNWGDLDCVSAEFVTDDEGYTRHRVYIEEASPDCRKINEFISERLAAAGFKDVEVATEW